MKKLVFILALLSTIIGASCSSTKDSYNYDEPVNYNNTMGRDPFFHGGYREADPAGNWRN